MSDFSRVAWTEGMFLRPQHFQQQERAFLSELASTLEKSKPYYWGVYNIIIDESLLNLSQFGIITLSAQMQDGVSISLPKKDALPSPLKIEKNTRDKTVYLAIPADKSNGLNLSDLNSTKVTRFHFEDHEIVDNSVGSEASEIIQVTKYSLELTTDENSLSGYVVLPIARIKEVDDDGKVVLDDKFIPPTINSQSNSNIKRFIHDLRSVVKLRADSIASRLGQGQGTSNSIIDFLMLQALNRYEPLLIHLEQTNGTHPEEIFRIICSMSGEMATFSSHNKRPPILPVYQHDELTTVFGSLMLVVNQYMSTVLEQTALQLNIESAKYGIKVVTVPDKTLFDSGVFVLSVKADISVEELRKRFPAQIKIGPVEHIRDLVNNQLPGVSISPLPVAPRQIPYNAGYHYFQLDQKNSYWNRLSASGGIALHLSGRYPNLDIQMWAIK
ncbi:type VI secretion system baseplate subunit TssK [Photobacterium sp. TY1-4]|uniref:type VI secretion system baseplate subunit TssK n=1 Tax=Photobacterium sp. TY1-4 TaxID=2899122 RepID=UPI0021C1F003|nr:type VI secretion system baseplate subunit TssK [Photobacterium sp. TY1-4]UXI02680.1 type VI secretion system baseplate subunit TssK [Photobacterium sp. TY1-4]